MMVSTWWLMVAFVVGIYAGVSLMAVLYFAARETDDVADLPDTPPIVPPRPLRNPPQEHHRAAPR